MPLADHFRVGSTTNHALLGVSLEPLTAAADTSIPAPIPWATPSAPTSPWSALRPGASPAGDGPGAKAPAKRRDWRQPPWDWIAGGAIATVDGLATWVEDLVGGNLLDPAMQRQRLASIRPTGPGNTAGAG